MNIKRWITVECEDTWLLDTQFLFSGYSCSWGNGCKGIFGQSSMGCCAIGAPIYDEELKAVDSRVAMLGDNEWQLKRKRWKHRNRRKGIQSRYNTEITTTDDGVEGCVFSNRPDFAGGAGCAFHIAALNRGEDPMDWKPEVCWSVPLSVYWAEEIHAYVVRMVGRLDWQNGDDSFELHEWWCADDSTSWQGKEPTFRTYAKELERLISGMGDPMAWPTITTALEALWEELPHDSRPQGPKPVPVNLISRNPDHY